MSAADSASKEAAAWFVEADHVSVTALARRRSRARIDEERAKSGRIVIVASLFLVLLAAALLVGGHAAIDPLLQSAAAAREAKGAGAVVYTMPDGIFCRHVSFDNVTAEITEGPSSVAGTTSPAIGHAQIAGLPGARTDGPP
jgi:hypothetical protein